MLRFSSPIVTAFMAETKHKQKEENEERIKRIKKEHQPDYEDCAKNEKKL